MTRVVSYHLSKGGYASRDFGAAQVGVLEDRAWVFITQPLAFRHRAPSSYGLARVPPNEERRIGEATKKKAEADALEMLQALGHAQHVKSESGNSAGCVYLSPSLSLSIIYIYIYIYIRISLYIYISLSIYIYIYTHLIYLLIIRTHITAILPER